MVNVTVVFKNGNVVEFAAEEFDVSLTANPARANKYPYKDAQGNDSAIYLRANDVAGVFLTQPLPGESRAVTTKVPGP